MRIGYVADCHVGNHRRFGGKVEGGINQRCEAAINALAVARNQARVLGCQFFAVLGDLFDTADPTPQIVQRTYEALSPGYDRGKSAAMTVVVLLGNHDQVSAAPGDNAVRVLDHQREDVIAADSPMTCKLESGTEMLLVPFDPRPGDEYIPPFLGSMKPAGFGDFSGILALHTGLRMGDEPPWLANAHDSVDAVALAEKAARAGYHSIIAGNWHKTRDTTAHGCRLIQCGALVPTGFDNPGLEGYGSLWIYDDQAEGSWERLEIAGPRFVTATVDTLEEVAAQAEAYVNGSRDPGMPQAFLRVDVPPDRVAWAKMVLAAAPSVVYEVALSREAATATAREAAQAAASSTGVDAALAAFVAEMPLADGVDRGRVLQQAQAHLRS